MTKPAKFKMHMCDVLTFKDGKVIAEEVFFDTAQIPEEARETMDNLLPHKKAA